MLTWARRPPPRCFLPCAMRCCESVGRKTQQHTKDGNSLTTITTYVWGSTTTHHTTMLQHYLWMVTFCAPPRFSMFSIHSDTRALRASSKRRGSNEPRYCLKLVKCSGTVPTLAVASRAAARQGPHHSSPPSTAMLNADGASRWGGGVRRGGGSAGAWRFVG